MRLPYLHLLIEIPWLRVKTLINYRCCENMCHDYVALSIKLCNRWSWEFYLYSPGRP